MVAPLVRFVDWSALQLLALTIPPADAQAPRLNEALQFLNGPDFIPEESQPAELEFNSRTHFRFPTPRRSDVAKNNSAYGRLYRTGEHWRERPVILLLPGGRLDFFYHRCRFPSAARRCNRAGFNAATLVLPYHSERRPARIWTACKPDYLRFAQAMAQAIAEIRALTGWLLQEGCPTVALWGISLGGWLAGLTAGRDARLAALVLTAPGVGFACSSRDQVFWPERAIWPGIRDRWRAQRPALQALNQTPVNLATCRPAIPKENILLVEGIHDLCVPKEAVEELWQSWGQPEVWRLPYGHAGVAGMCVPGVTARTLSWLAPKLKAPANQTPQAIG